METAGAIAWPTFGAWKVTVTDASTAAPATMPVEASTPDGRSTETTGTAPAFSSPMARSASGRGLPLNPVPERVDGQVCGAVLVDEGHACFPGPSEGRGRVSGDLLIRPEQAHRRGKARARELGGGDEPVAAVAPVAHQTATCRASGNRARISSATHFPRAPSARASGRRRRPRRRASPPP